MSLPHLSSGQVASVLPLGERLGQTPTTALFKESRLEVMRLVLSAGKHLPAHAVAGPITVQCLEGDVDIGVDGSHRLLRPGDLVYLASGAAHDVTAISDASLLVTIVLVERGGS
ncbi:cupin domain-containing protein [Cupriavidus basilensis]|uniref:Cupin domain-containing protein n=1 Tax=Cupriavidus basilensis TaxID=68895 RepID=A0ABT6AS21_9BURK|nr:cupin domain-containing protein [Cupriavidus basilensis]MDF3835425.1 cupin domain-containing protein [Cupriavidus basilensis]